MKTEKRLRVIAARWGKWVGPDGDVERYSDLASKTNEALDALDEVVALRARVAELEKALREATDLTNLEDLT